MNNLYFKAASALFMASFAMNASAQIPNGGFDTGWALKTPFQTALTDQAKIDDIVNNNMMIAPEGWTGSNILGNNQGSGYQVVLERSKKGEGYNGSDYAAILTTKKTNIASVGNPLMAPAYISLGTTWLHGSVSFTMQGGFGYKVASAEWGTYGGAEFTARPDAIAFYYKLEGENVGQGSVVAYTWKGTTSQPEIKAGISSNPPAMAEPMVDRDRNILGMETTVGGEVTKSADFELVASVNNRIDAATDWTLCEAPFTYASTAAPEKINIILAAGNYFGTNDDQIADAKLTVDDVKAVYYSRIRSIKVGDFTMKLEAGKYTFDVPADYPENKEDLIIELWGQDAKVQMIYPTPSNKSYSIAVKNDSGNDIDGKGFHAYTLHFTGAPEPVEPEGNLTIDLWKVAAAAFPTAYTEKIGSMTGNISYDEATKHYTIKDFLGIKKANLTFYIDENGTPESPVDLGYGTTNPMKNNVEGFENEDDYMVRIVMPDASEQQGDLADWTNIIIPVVNSWNEKDHKTFTFKFSEESFNQKDIKPEFATGIFKGEENDYMLLNPSFGGHWGDAAQIRQSSMKKCHAAKIDNKWTVRIYCNGTSVNQKASADAEWEWNRETYRLSSPLIMFTIPTDLGAGVEGIEIENGIDENAPVEYYNLQGIKVENPAAGLYIKRQGNKVEKVVIR